jgi:hypothetical protein
MTVTQNTVKKIFFNKLEGCLLTEILGKNVEKKIRLKKGNKKCRQLKKLTYKGTLRQVFICLRPRTTYPLHNVNVYTVFLFTQGWGGGRIEPGEKGEGNSSQSWVENTNMTDSISNL